MERIQKILASAGLASRRRSEELIRQGRVIINGRVAKIGETANERDLILVNGVPVKRREKIYIMLNKPKSYVTTVSESHGMKTVMDLVKTSERVYPVGRLDKNTEGLLIFTNDGNFANFLTHPRYNVQKEYYVILDKPLSENSITMLKKGVVVFGKKVEVEKLTVNGREIILTIHEGRKHIVRKVFESLGHTVKRLVRTKIGPFHLGNIPPGKWRTISLVEINKVLRYKRN